MWKWANETIVSIIGLGVWSDTRNNPSPNRGHVMNAFIILIDQVINIFIWTLLAYIIVGWLIAFRIVNPWQPAVRMIVSILGQIHEPILSLIRRFMPNLGGIDLSPIVIFLVAQFIRNLLVGIITA